MDFYITNCRMRKILPVYFTVLLAIAQLACASGIADLNPQDIALKSVEALRSLQLELSNAIDSEIGEAKCERDGQCKALAIGANPCGGPEAYKTYSEAETDVARLIQLAEQYKIVRKTLHAKTGTMGACVVIPQPGVQCENRRCVIVQTHEAPVF